MCELSVKMLKQDIENSLPEHLIQQRQWKVETKIILDASTRFIGGGVPVYTDQEHVHEDLTPAVRRYHRLMRNDK